MHTAPCKIYLVLVTVVTGFVAISAAGRADPLPTWDDQINNPTRFGVLSEFNGAAVFDKETGLVWEQSPDSAEIVWTEPFLGAVEKCYTKSLGGRRGWRLPTVEELNSLRLPGQSNPPLPPGHPFSNIAGTYWSITTDPSLPSRAYAVNFSGLGFTSLANKSGNKLRAWCVRGGHGHDGQ